MLHVSVAYSFLLLNSNTLIVWIYYILLIHSSVNGHLGYLQFGAITQVILLWIFLYMFLTQMCKDFCRRHSKSAVHRLWTYLTFMNDGIWCQMMKKSSQLDVPNYIPINSERGFLFLHLPTLVFPCLSKSVRYKAVLICISPMISDVEHLFVSFGLEFLF